MKKLLFLALLLIGSSSFSQTTSELYKELGQLRKKANDLNKNFENGVGFCSGYYPEYSAFRRSTNKIPGYYSNKTINDYQNSINYLKKLKIKYLKQNGAHTRFISNALMYNKIVQQIKSIEQQTGKNTGFYYQDALKNKCNKIESLINSDINDLEKRMKRKSSEPEPNKKAEGNDDNPSSGDDSQETPKQTGANPNQQNSGGSTEVQRINDEYNNFLKTNAKASEQLSNGDFIGAAKTYSKGGRKTEMYGALAGHVATQFVTVLNNNRLVKIEETQNTLQKKIEDYDLMFNKTIQLISNNEIDAFFKNHKKLLTLENSIFYDSNWLGNKHDPKFFEITEEIRKKQFSRIKIALKYNTEKILNYKKDKHFVDKLIDIHFDELEYQTYKRFVKTSFNYNQEHYATKLWELINQTQNNRIDFLLNNKLFVLDKLTQLQIYITSNLKNDIYNKKSLEIFKSLSFYKKRYTLFLCVERSMPSGKYFYFHKNTPSGFLNLKLNYDKLNLLVKDDSFNYYLDFSYYSKKDKVPFYKYLKTRSGSSNTSGIIFNKFHAFRYSFDENKNVYNYLLKKVKLDTKSTNKKEKQLFNERKNCITVNCK